MFKTLTALYVEDEIQIQEVVSMSLKYLFGNLILASNGEEGLEKFIENKDEINIIITDINMPKMNGLEMAQEIRKLNIHIPIIITSAHNDKDFLHQAITVGVSGFVTKPMNMEILLQTIQKNVEPIVLQQKLDIELQQNQNERLRNAKFSAIGELAAGITHEINTPLTYIKASFEMLGYDIDDLEETKLKDNMQKDIERIQNGLFRIENIISSMKEMSHQSSHGKEDSSVYDTVVTATILAFNKIKHISNVYINGTVFNLDIKKDASSYITKLQKQRIEQVWIIIINNAMDELMKIEKFQDRKLEINIIEDDTYISVSFKDNAGGIPDDIMPDLFEPFKGTKESSGMGVGLSIAKRIIADQENATIEAYNEDGGAVFKVQFSKEEKDDNVTEV